MKIYLVRHGETEANRKDLLLGWTDQPLNDQGIAVAVNTRKRMDAAGISFDRVISSPLKRAVETARILAPGCPIRLDEQLKEIFFGSRELDYAPHLRGVTFPCPGGEDLESFRNRVLCAWNEIIQDPENRSAVILVSTHGTVIRALLAAIKGVSDILSLPGQGNCCATILDVNEATSAVSILEENVSF